MTHHPLRLRERRCAAEIVTQAVNGNCGSVGVAPELAAPLVMLSRRRCPSACIVICRVGSVGDDVSATTD